MQKKIVIAVVFGIVVLALAGYLVVGPVSNGNVNAEKVIAAAQAYGRGLQAAGKPPPDSVPLETLVADGLLRKEDVSGFAGIQVTVYLRRDPNQPQSTLMRAKLPDGHEVVVMTDGTVRAE